MSHVYFTSDWHFGHSGITDRFRPQFPNLEVMEEHLLSNCMETINKRDVLYCLGDMAFDNRGLQKLREIPCRKILVRGNHDTLSTLDYLSVFDEVEGVVQFHKFWLTHIPIHPQELYSKKNIHGHCHRGGPDGPNYFNAIVEFNDYLPVRYDSVLKQLQLRKRHNEGKTCP